MAALKHRFQKEVFSPSEEVLQALVRINKRGSKKKKTDFLCIAGKLPRLGLYFYTQQD